MSTNHTTLPQRGSVTPANPTTRQRNNKSRLLLTILVASAFGPYLVRGLRTDDVGVYALGAALLPLVWVRLRPSPALAAIIASWLLLFGVAAIGSIDPPPNTTGYPSGSALANLDNLVLPLVTTLVVLALLEMGADREVLIRRTAGIVVIAMSVNAFIALLQTRFPLDSYLARWWASTDESVATRAVTLGRFTGIIAQPALAGIMYSIALLCALYVLHHRPAMLAPVGILLVLGGALAVSKAFFIVGLPVAGWHWLKMGNQRQRRLVAVIGASAAALSMVSLGLLDKWSGAARLKRLLPTGDAAQLQFYAGNRYGTQAATEPVLTAVLREAPVAGLGLDGLGTSTDTMWLYALTLAGLLGVAAIATVLIVLLVAQRRRRSGMPEAERRLFDGMVIVVAATCLGFPGLTGNRLAVIEWTLIVLLLAAPINRAAPRDTPGRLTRRLTSSSSSFPSHASPMGRERHTEAGVIRVPDRTARGD